MRYAIHEEVSRCAYDSVQNSFIRSYGAKVLDTSLLLLPLVGFLPASDPRIQGTVDAVQRRLSWDGLLLATIPVLPMTA